MSHDLRPYHRRCTIGTRADFYVGRGETAEWLGSIAFDGYPEGVGHDKYPAGKRLLAATTEREYRQAVADFFAERGDQVTRPDQGWPWPWPDSRTTDYAYTFDEGRVLASDFGHAWFDPTAPRTDPELEAEERQGKVAVFPNMKDRQKVTLGPRSGLIVMFGP